MAKEIIFKNDRISKFEGLVTLTLTLTLDQVILSTVVHHLSISANPPNFFEIEEFFVDGRTYVRTHVGPTYVRMDGRTLETGFIRSTSWKSRRKN